MNATPVHSLRARHSLGQICVLRAHSTQPGRGCSLRFHRQSVWIKTLKGRKNHLATDGETLKKHREREIFKPRIAAQLGAFFSGLFHPSLRGDIKVSASLNFLIARTYFLCSPSARSHYELSPKQHDTTYCKGKMIIRRNIRAEELVWKNALVKWSDKDCF